ncbi:hypothetical protein Tco_0574447 [Tanacetum coccineum]
MYPLHLVPIDPLKNGESTLSFKLRSHPSCCLGLDRCSPLSIGISYPTVRHVTIFGAFIALWSTRTVMGVFKRFCSQSGGHKSSDLFIHTFHGTSYWTSLLKCSDFHIISGESSRILAAAGFYNLGHVVILLAFPNFYSTLPIVVTFHTSLLLAFSATLVFLVPLTDSRCIDLMLSSTFSGGGDVEEHPYYTGFGLKDQDDYGVESVGDVE